MIRRLNVLIACEESGVESKAFREMGCNAYSCDIQKPARGADERYHIMQDVTPLLRGGTKFRTLDGKSHQVKRWHLIIAHPPCTYLCKVGSPWLHKDPDVWIVFRGKNMHLNSDRLDRLERARNFFYECLNAQADFVAVENPLPMAIARLPKPSCFVSPEWYGHKYTKKTLYWLRNLPPLMAGATNPETKQLVHSSRGKYRSRSFSGVAEAMAKQWVPFCLNELKK